MVKLTDEILKEAKNLYQNGNSLKNTIEIIHQKYNIKIGKETLRTALWKRIKLRNNWEYLNINRGCVLNPNKIKKLYVVNKLSLKDIAQKFNASATGIKWILIKNNVNLRSKYEGLLLKKRKYTKYNFYGNEKEKAYLIGITLGDAHVRAISNYTLEVNTTSTHKSLINIFSSLYKKYTTGVIVSKDKNKGFRFCAYINNSFKFLLDVKKNNEIVNDLGIIPFLEFLAGFFDAEGSIVKSRHRKNFRCVVKIGNTDKELLNIIKNKLETLSIYPKIYCYSKAGRYHYYKGKNIINRKAYYMLEINKRNEILQLFKILNLKHKEKIARKNWALNFLN